MIERSLELIASARRMIKLIATAVDSAMTPLNYCPSLITGEPLEPESARSFEIDFYPDRST